MEPWETYQRAEMGRISSSIGLITGTAIQDTVDQLVKLSARPRERLESTNQRLNQQRTALTNLTVVAISVQLSARSLGDPTGFQRSNVTSGDPNSVSATRTGAPSPGEFRVQTLQTASTHAFTSRSFSNASRPLGSAGAITIRGGGSIDRSLRLDQLNGGRGVQEGSIRITDRSGQSKIVDLSRVVNVEDVLRSINEAGTINVRAIAQGDAIRLVDLTGASSSNLIVEEVGGGNTAADLGMRGINTAASSATGSDILRLSPDMNLAELRDGRGFGFGNGKDVKITLRDGTEVEVDFADFSRAANFSSGVTQNPDSDAKLTFRSKETGGLSDGVRVRFVDDPAIAVGEESVQRMQSSGGSELVFRIREGTTTAADIARVLEDDPVLSLAFEALAGGDGTGLVAAADEASLSGGAAISAVSDPQVSDLLRVFNQANPSKLRAEFAPGADRLRLVDLTDGSGNLVVENLGSATVASELGLTGSFAASSVTGGRLLSGLNSVSLSALRGGTGLGSLGDLQITTSSGTTQSVDLSAAETVQDVINAINNSGLQVEAGISNDGGGLQLRDLSGGTSALFSISSSDQTAALLGVRKETSDALIQGDNLNLQFVSRGTSLSQLNQGQGVGDRVFRITDAAGVVKTVDIRGKKITTVGGLIDEINSLGLGLTAAINESGDGIRLIQTTTGAGAMRVEDLAGGNTAAKLGLAGTARQEVVSGGIVSTINARQVDVFTFASTETLGELAVKIRTSGRFARAALASDSSGGASLTITSSRGGNDGRIGISTSGLDLGLRQTAQGRDAVISLRQGDNPSGIRLRSSDGVFGNAITGVSLTAKTVSDRPTTISIAKDASGLESTLDRFVTQFNAALTQIKQQTFYDPATATSGILFGRSEVLQLQSAMSEVIAARSPISGSIKTAGDLGLRMGGDGQLQLDKVKFREVLAAEPAAVEKFVTTEKLGLVPRVDALIEQFTGTKGGILLSRTVRINDQLEQNTTRINSMNIRLDRQRNRLLTQFYAMESAIAKVQSNQKYLGSISYIQGPADNR